MAARPALRPSELVTWDPQHEETVARYVQELMGILWVDEGGRVKTTQHFKLDAYLRILSRTVHIRGVEDPRAKRLLMQGAAFLRLKKYEVQNLHTFRRALAAQAREYVGRQPRDYWILFPLHARPTELDGFRWFTVLETRLLVRGWERIRRDFDLDAFDTDTSVPLQGLTISLEADFTAMVAKAQGRDSHEAFREAANAFDLFCSLLNLALKFGLSTKRWGFQTQPLGPVLPPPVYGVFGSDGAYVEYWYNTARYQRYDRNSVQAKDLAAARKLARRFGASVGKNETLALVVEALHKYGEALQAAEWRQCFLLLWQILELLSLQTGGNVSMKRVTNRVGALLHQDQLVCDLLPVLYQTRNELVHLGRFPQGDEEALTEINLLKYVVDRSLDAMIDKSGQLRSASSLEKFYTHATERTASLSDRQRVIGHIRRNRAKGDNA
ncbi:MAG TPA: hypothetical protein VM537_06240 [Anaerolineae bacterium]|nr:hypothetical protein [Anaerolineae bacterium]